MKTAPKFKVRKMLVEFSVLSNYTVHVEITTDLMKSCASYKNTKDIIRPEDHAYTHALVVHPDGIGQSYMFLPPTAEAGTIAHECWHVIRYMMEYLGIELDNEAVAYHLGYLVDETTKFLQKKKK